jgi:hypothetical protein
MSSQAPTTNKTKQAVKPTKEKVALGAAKASTDKVAAEPGKTATKTSAEQPARSGDVLRSDAQEIDSLFSAAISKKRSIDESKRKAEEEEATRRKRERRLAEESKRAVEIVNPEPQIHRWDQDSGLPVYKYYHLRMGENGSGFTPQCPFDCSCCF